MKITTNTTLENFDAWSGAKDTKETILNEDKGADFDMLIDELYPDGMTETELNDLLWFEDKFLFQNLGIEIED